MKKWNEISEKQKIISIILLFIIFMSFVFYLKYVLDDDNYITVIDCGDGNEIILEGKQNIDIDDYCGKYKQNNYYKYPVEISTIEK